MTTDLIRLRSEFLNTQVITRSTGKRLGVVKEILVDIDRRQVVAFGLRDNILALSGMPKYMYLESVRQTGDVILVEDEDALEDIDIERYSSLINCEVITETGEPLGRVRDFQFNLEDGTVSALIIASLGIPQIPEQILSTYQLPIEEIISSGPNRLIVFEGAEDRITQLSVGLLERLGIGRPPWEREEEEMYYPPTAKPENQLGTGIPVAPPVIETRTPVREPAWDEDQWEETPIAPPPRRQAETIRYPEYDDDEEDNWSEAREDIPVVNYEPQPPIDEDDYPYEDDEFEEDVWDDDVKPEPYNPPKINIPEKKREYEEETDY
jgi:sporulation protein YlmC with PRC-barrel domain